MTLRRPTSAAFVTEQRSDVRTTSSTCAGSHQTLVTVGMSVTGADRQVRHRTHSAGTSTAAPADGSTGVVVDLADLTDRTLHASTRVYTQHVVLYQAGVNSNPITK